MKALRSLISLLSSVISSRLYLAVALITYVRLHCVYCGLCHRARIYPREGPSTSTKSTLTVETATEFDESRESRDCRGSTVFYKETNSIHHHKRLGATLCRTTPNVEGPSTLNMGHNQTLLDSPRRLVCLPFCSSAARYIVSPLPLSPITTTKRNGLSAMRVGSWLEPALVPAAGLAHVWSVWDLGVESFREKHHGRLAPPIDLVEAGGVVKLRTAAGSTRCDF